MNTRRITLATLALVATALNACSSDTTSTLDSASSTSVEETTTVPVDETTTTVIVESTPVATEPPATAPPATAPPTAPPATAPPGPTLWQQVVPPTMPSNRTDPFGTSGALANGRYWVQYNGGETMTPDITVLQAFFGAECEAQATIDGDECLNDIYVRADPYRDIDTLPFANNVFLTVAASSQPGLSYFITPAELRQIRASSPSAGAPSGFSFTPFPWLMTVQNGQITHFEQLWTP